VLFGVPKCKGVYIIGYTSFDMGRITERIRLALKLVKRIEAEAKLQKTSVTQFVRTAVERYLDELAKHKISAKDTAGKPKEVNLILETPITLWTQAEKEFADKVIQRHFDEDR
jgi:predicted DNA-binding protein